MRSRATALLMMAVVAVAAMALLASTAGAKMKPKITSVRFRGTPAAPTITVKGRGLGSLPVQAAEEVPACYSEEVATGNDYGSLFVLEDQTQGWTAGEGAGDCIGVIFSTYTETEIVFHLGSAYSHYSPVAKADTYKMTVGGLTRTGVVNMLRPPKS